MTENMGKRKLKVCVGASSGGHMTELLGLLATADSWPVQPSIYVTTRPIWSDQLEKLGKSYVIGECDRYKPLQSILVLFRALSLVIRERPDVVITTGSFPIALVCIWAKLFRAKVIWIDSVAQLEDLSMSGKLMRHFADLCFTQWPEVAELYSNVEYAGELQ